MPTETETPTGGGGGGATVQDSGAVSGWDSARALAKTWVDRTEAATALGSAVNGVAATAPALVEVTAMAMAPAPRGESRGQGDQRTGKGVTAT